MTSARVLNNVAIVVLAVVAATMSWRASQRTITAVGEAGLRGDVAWFGEPLRVQRFVDHELEHELLSPRAPLEPVIVRAPVRAWLRLRPADNPIDVLRAYVAFAAALWAALVFMTLRALGCGVLASVLFTLIGLASAAAHFWFALPASVAIGGVSTLPALLLVARSAAGPSREWPATLAASATVSVSAVNAVFGVAAAVLIHRWRRGIQIIVNGMCIVLLLWPLQRVLYPASGPLPPPAPPSPGRAATAIFDAVMMPVQALVGSDRGVMLQGGLGYTLIGFTGIAAWCLLLAAGSVHLARRPDRRLAIVIPVVLVARLLAGLLAGEPSFHAALDVLPLLLIVAALGTLTERRRTVLGAGAVLLGLMLVNQTAAFASALAWLGGVP
jgi:hypothetical protein